MIRYIRRTSLRVTDRRMQDRRLCVLNAGSSSLKFAVYGVADVGVRRLQSGEVERIGGEGRLLITSADGKALHDRMVTTTDHASALAMLAPAGWSADAAGTYRVRSSSSYMAAPIWLDQCRWMPRLEALQPLAPLHNPPAVAVIKVLSELFPTLPHVACFDTAFDRSHPAVTDRFAISDALYREGVRRYGFHGLSEPRTSPALWPNACRRFRRDVSWWRISVWCAEDAAWLLT